MRSRFLINVSSSLDLSIKIDTDKIYINYSFVDINGNQIEDKNGSMTFSLEELQNKRNWRSGSTFAFLFDIEKKVFLGIENNTAKSYSSKYDPSLIFTNDTPNIISPIELIIPFENANFSEIGIIITQQKDRKLEVSGELNNMFTDYTFSLTEKRSHVRSFLPMLNIEGPDTLKINEAGIYNITAKQNGILINKPLNIYLSTSSGYISKQKVILINGTGRFIFRAVDLEVGDEAKINGGFYYLSGKVYKKIGVING